MAPKGSGLVEAGIVLLEEEYHCGVGFEVFLAKALLSVVGPHEARA